MSLSHYHVILQEPDGPIYQEMPFASGRKAIEFFLDKSEFIFGGLNTDRASAELKLESMVKSNNSSEGIYVEYGCFRLVWMPCEDECSFNIWN